MNIIHIDEKTHNLLNQWDLENSELIKKFTKKKQYYFEKCVFQFDEDYTVYFTVAKNKVKWSCKSSKIKMQILKGSIVDPLPDDSSDIGIKYQIVNQNTSTEMTNEVAAELVQLFVGDFIDVNCIFYFGNIVDSNTAIQGKSTGNDKHYFIREYNGEMYAVNSHNHRSPEGVFGVRGHFRKYENGKIIWIDEYLKGIDKENKIK